MCPALYISLFKTETVLKGDQGGMIEPLDFIILPSQLFLFYMQALAKLVF